MLCNLVGLASSPPGDLIREHNVEKLF